MEVSLSYFNTAWGCASAYQLRWYRQIHSLWYLVWCGKSRETTQRFVFILRAKDWSYLGAILCFESTCSICVGTCWHMYVHMWLCVQFNILCVKCDSVRVALPKARTRSLITRAEWGAFVNGIVTVCIYTVWYQMSDTERFYSFFSTVAENVTKALSHTICVWLSACVCVCESLHLPLWIIFPLMQMTLQASDGDIWKDEIKW